MPSDATSTSPVDGILPSDAVTDATVQLLKGFAAPTRLRILCVLRHSERQVQEIVDALAISQSAVSHQLRNLRDARLVTSRRDGRHVYYALADQHVADLLDNALSHGREAIE